MKVKKYLNPSSPLIKRKRRLFYFTPEQEKLFNLITVPGTNINSNTTDARKTGVQALNFLAQEAARKDAEIESRSERKTVKRLTTVGEKLRGDNGYSSYMSGGTGMSGRDPLLGTIFDWTVGAKGLETLGKTALWNFAKHVPTSELGKWGRNYFINNTLKLELRKPVLFGLGKNVAESAYVSSAPKPSDTGLTSLKFFERPTYLSPLVLAGATRWERNFKPRWHVANYPGYLLKGLMGGSPLERLLSKNGTINVNLLNAYFNKASQIEREVANKVLAEKFAGLKTIDYNLFKRAILDKLIGKYNRVPLTEWADYGMEGLGFETQISHDGNAIAYNEITGDFEQVAPFTPFKPNYQLNTFTFESPRIPYGNTKHYGGNPIGHSRTYTLPEDPHTLYVMESQSDWALLALRHKGSIDAQSAYERASLMAEKHQQEIELMKANLEKGLTPEGHKIQYDWERGDIEEIIKTTEKLLSSNNARAARFDAILHPEKYVLENHLKQNYLQRQLQENLRYAAENGLTKMRYPTSETATKIEGYLPNSYFYLDVPEYKELAKKFNDPNTPIDKQIELMLLMEKIKEQANAEGNIIMMPSEYQTILKKYADFPKLFLKLYKGLNVRTVTDAKGNTWYEVDIPKGYLSKEWQFRRGGNLTINNTDI